MDRAARGVRVCQREPGAAWPGAPEAVTAGPRRGGDSPRTDGGLSSRRSSRPPQRPSECQSAGNRRPGAQMGRSPRGRCPEVLALWVPGVPASSRGWGLSASACVGRPLAKGDEMPVGHILCTLLTHMHFSQLGAKGERRTFAMKHIPLTSAEQTVVVTRQLNHPKATKVLQFSRRCSLTLSHRHRPTAPSNLGVPGCRRRKDFQERTSPPARSVPADVPFPLQPRPGVGACGCVAHISGNGTAHASVDLPLPQPSLPTGTPCDRIRVLPQTTTKRLGPPVGGCSCGHCTWSPFLGGRGFGDSAQCDAGRSPPFHQDDASALLAGAGEPRKPQNYSEGTEGLPMMGLPLGSWSPSTGQTAGAGAPRILPKRSAEWQWAPPGEVQGECGDAAGGQAGSSSPSVCLQEQRGQPRAWPLSKVTRPGEAWKGHLVIVTVQQHLVSPVTFMQVTAPGLPSDLAPGLASCGVRACIISLQN